MNNTYLSFVVGDELFAVNVHKVLEVLQKQRITTVPNTPDFVKGIINFRGEIVPVFETRTKFNLTERDAMYSYVIMILDLQSANSVIRVGAVVDKVKNVITINDNEVKPVPPMSSKFNSEFLHGIVKDGESFILLLNVDKIFSDGEINELNETAKAQ
jgi:purine-binding chemotaxis protein CheW